MVPAERFSGRAFRVRRLREIRSSLGVRCTRHNCFRLKERLPLSTFETLGLADSLLRAVRAEGYHTATPIQLQAIPPVLAGRDLMGCAQTGTGKTAAFALPTLQRLSIDVSRATLTASSRTTTTSQRQASRAPRAASAPIRSLILAPTRELAAQIGASFATYGRYTGLRYTVVYGGVGQGPQVRALQNGRRHPGRHARPAARPHGAGLHRPAATSRS